jgi:hypothetical protein
MNQRKDDYMRGYSEGFREAREMYQALPHVVEYRQIDNGPWMPMAAFDHGGPAQRYAEACGVSNKHWEYRVTSRGTAAAALHPAQQPPHAGDGQ